jgi:hypothetical protein
MGFVHRLESFLDHKTHLTDMVAFFKRDIDPFLTLEHAGDTERQARALFPEFAVFFEGQVVIRFDLLEQDWFKFGWDQSWSARTFERG